MKKTTLTLAASVLMGSIGLGALTGHAADYEDALNATSEGAVTIVENDLPDDTIPDPENPDQELDPETPVNPNPGQLRINYVSNFDFGKIKNTSGAMTLEAKLDTLWLADGTETERVPFVTTEDRRGTDRKGWELRVSQPKPLADAAGNELQGATIQLNGLRYSNAGTDSPVVTGGTITLAPSEQVLARANEAQGAGARSLALGSATEQGTTNGVTLNIPANTIRNNTEYTSSIVWELVADPTTN